KDSILQAGNPVKEILLKLNLPDHRILKDGGEAYKDMQQKIERLQAQLGDLKGKSKDTSCVSDTRHSLSQKLENENVQLEFQVSNQKDNTHDTSVNTKFAKQPIVENLPKVGETNALSKPVTSNSVSTPQEPKVVKNDKVIAPGTFKINPDKTFKEERNVPNTVRESNRTKPITVSQPPEKTLVVGNIRQMFQSSKIKRNISQRLRSQRRLFDQEGKLVSSSESESQFDCSNGDNACTSNTMEPKIKQFPNFTSLLGRNIFVLPVNKEKAKEHLIHQNQFQIQGRDYIFFIWILWTNENCQYKWKELFLWAEAIATTCFTQNRSIIHRRFNKTPYELINGRKPDILFLHVFGALCYPKNDRKDIEKLGAKGDIGFFIGSGLELTYAPSTITTQQPTEGELDLLFEAMYDDYIGGQPSATARTVPPTQEPQLMHICTFCEDDDSAALVDEFAKGLTNVFPSTIAFELSSSTSYEVIGIFVAREDEFVGIGAM
nr:retrovirus-related Pol polyprotein from transposon TNT 1-94 [Tanacetum cinerariifolium]